MNQSFTIYYDGACGICRAEMAKLRAKNSQGRMVFVDASRPDFNAEAMGLNRDKLRQVLHLKDEQGRLYLGVDAFGIIWRLTGHPILALLCRMPGSKQIAKVVYRIFARYRYVFSSWTTKPHCDDESCSWERV